MKITKRQLKKLLYEARYGPLTEADPPGTVDYSAQAIGERIADAAYDVIDDYVGWMARQGMLSNVMDEILRDASEIGKVAGEEIENVIAMEMDMAQSEQETGHGDGTRLSMGGAIGERFDPSAPPKKDLADFSEEYDVAEYDRGYQDGFDSYPVADDATPDYDAGYEDGKLDADLPEIPYDEARSKDW